ncbi:MAG: DUF3825 domain-containing protein [Acidobacteriaceae bacterium]
MRHTRMQISKYQALYTKFKNQPVQDVLAHFHPDRDPLTGSQDFDAPFRKIAAMTLEGPDAWEFTQPKFQNKYHSKPPKLRNYLLYTFARLRALEIAHPGEYFAESEDKNWVCFNTGLQDKHSADLYAIFLRYEPKPGINAERPVSDWVYRGTVTSRLPVFRDHFGTKLPKLAWYSTDSRDYIFNTDYDLETDIFDHMFERAKERSGFPEDVTDESVRNYLRGAIENLLPKIKRNYKTAIPVYYIEEERMQLLLPFHSSNGRDTACFLIERDDQRRCYRIKTILDMDHAFFAARLITRPDKEWLNP